MPRTVPALKIVMIFLLFCAPLFADDTLHQSDFYATFYSLIPPILAITLALITKEIYSSLFVGIISGALLHSNFEIQKSISTIFFGGENGGDFRGGIFTELSDSWNLSILIFIVILGVVVTLTNKSGAPLAYEKWAKKRIKNKKEAQLATVGLGLTIFMDDYFNCLSVGNIMRSITDSYKISRAKLAYLVDSTAAPICILIPISSAAIVASGFIGKEHGLTTFISTIPYNFYAILTLVMMICIIVMEFDFSQMKTYEMKAQEQNAKITTEPSSSEHMKLNQENNSPKGGVLDLILPMFLLIIFCLICMINTGGYFDQKSEYYLDFLGSFANCDAANDLVLGGIITLVFIFFLYIPRKIITLKEYIISFPKGLKMMLSGIFILILAWTLSAIATLLGIDVYVANLLNNSNQELIYFMPIIIFIISFTLAFSIGTSWGTFGIIIPIVVSILSGELMIITISACLSGATCGDHCSPISDTTIISSVGSHCDHIVHVSTQLPYALVVAGVSLVSFAFAPFIQNAFVSLGISIALMILTLVGIKRFGRFSEVKTF